MTYILWVHRDGEWHLVGQYPTRQQANLIAADYRNRGEKIKITKG
jgi:hypothetical protein